MSHEESSAQKKAAFGVILTAEIDREQIIRDTYDLDMGGHYAPPGIFQLQVDEWPKRPVPPHASDAPRKDQLA